MKLEMRQHLAQLSFEEKIRKIGELVLLSRKIKTMGTRVALSITSSQTSRAT